MSSITPSARHFATKRLESFAGYHTLPTVHDPMHFYLPRFTLRATRFVHAGERLWELWSPNSQRFAFYPGVSKPNLRFGKDVDLELRRADGHLGRFDPTVSPQHFDQTRPWLGYILRESDSLPEFDSLLVHWRPTAAPNRGSFCASYLDALAKRTAVLVNLMESKEAHFATHFPELWENRPAAPTEADFQLLSSTMSFDEGVDTIADHHRSIRSVDAWCRMAVSLLQDSTSVTLTDVPPADDNLVGIWLNGCEERHGLLLLSHRVPCFIISEATSEADITRSNLDPLILADFFTGTPIAELRQGMIDSAVLREGGSLCTLGEDFGLALCPPPSTEADRKRASPTSQGWNRTSYEDPRLMMVPLTPDFTSAALTDGSRRVVSSADIQPLDSTNNLDDNRTMMGAASVPDESFRDRASPVCSDYEMNLGSSPTRSESPILNHVSPRPSPPPPASSVADDKRYRRKFRGRFSATPVSRPTVVGTNNRHYSPQPLRRSPSRVNKNSTPHRYNRRYSPMTPRAPPRTFSPTRPAQHIRHPSARSGPPHRYSPRVFKHSARRSYSPLRYDHGRSPVASHAPQRTSSPVRPLQRLHHSPTRRPVSSHLRLRFPDEARHPSGPRAREDGPSSMWPGVLRRTNVPYALLPPSNASALVSYSSPQTALTKVSALVSSHAPRLDEIFPIPSVPPLPTMSHIWEGSSKFLIIWNLPVYYTWEYVLREIRSLLSFTHDAKLNRILRTNEAGTQVFWLAFNSPKSATNFRGIVEGRHTSTLPDIKCSFVSDNEYSSVCGSARNAWSSKFGYQGTAIPTDCFDPSFQNHHPSALLARRLGIEVNHHQPKTKRGMRRIQAPPSHEGD